MFRLKEYFRYHFQLQSSSAATPHQEPPAQRPPTGVEFTLDVNPFNML